ncbi:MAG: ACT domain-containing protein [Desulfurococcaceae archaeon]|nr:ACT domain-containing protein [Desulfurococcaceae archaeon]
MSSISQVVTEVVAGDPILRQCVARGIVNYRKLAKLLQPMISQVLGKDVSVDAIKVALLRSSSKIGEEKGVRREVLDIIAKSSVELRTDITIIVVRSSTTNYITQLLTKIVQRARFVAVMQSVIATTIVIDRDAAEELLKNIRREDIIDVQRDQAAIVIVSPEEIMKIPGVLAYIANVLAQNNINIVHVESCYTDTIIIVSKSDLEKAFNVIMKHIEGAKKMLSLLRS